MEPRLAFVELEARNPVGPSDKRCRIYPLDVVLSLNGFHAFPNKDAAFADTFRVLRPSGTFCGCFYVRGGFARTDWFVEHLLVPKGAFTSPFETTASLEARLSSMYATCKLGQVNAKAYFVCRKA